MKKFEARDLERSAPIEFELVGKTYTARPMKKSSALMAVLVDNPKGQMKELDRMSSILNWFQSALSKNHVMHEVPDDECQACDIIARLSDDDDDLSFEIVTEAATWLIGEVSSRPTG